MLLHSVDHGIDGLLHALCLGSLANLTAEGDVVLASDDEEACDHETLGLGALGDVLCGLKALVGIPREAVEVETVVPVCTSDERQHVRTEVVDDVIHRDLQVLEEGDLRTGLVVEGHHLVEDREVARLLDIGHGAEDEPAGVVVEAAADIIVAALGEGLVLVVTATVGELRGSDVDDALTSAWGYLMDEAHEVLIGVAEAHATTYAALEERG